MAQDQGVMPELCGDTAGSKTRTEQPLDLGDDCDSKCILAAEARSCAGPVWGLQGYDDPALDPAFQSPRRNVNGPRYRPN